MENEDSGNGNVDKRKNGMRKTGKMESRKMEMSGIWEWEMGNRGKGKTISREWKCGKYENCKMEGG